MAEVVVGSKIGEQDRYKILKSLGGGGMSDVYLARDEKLERLVALKLIAEHLARHSAFVGKFQTEARILASLTHPNIVQVFDVGQHHNRPFLAMQYLEGRPLFDALQSEGPWPPQRVLTLLRDLASALDYAHNRNILHRDIKSSNIMIAADDHATLTDFGVAAFVADALITGKSTPVDRTEGTAAYSSPEQITGAVVGSKSDIYSLGVVIYEMLAGRLPFEVDRMQTLVYKIAHEEPPPLSDVNPRIPPAITAVVERALSKDPDQRYDTAGAFGNAFAAAVGVPIPTTAGTTGAPERSSAGSAPPPAAAPSPPPDPDAYRELATADKPALIIYLLDISRSMGDVLGNTTRLQVVRDALNATVRQMVARSTRGNIVSPRYRVAVLGYSDQVYDLLLGQPYTHGQTGSVKLLDKIARMGMIEKLELNPLKTTNTAAAFEAAEDILQDELPMLQNSPAPLVCHLTDGMYTDGTPDPEPIARRIKAMRVPDGNVLIETVFMSESVLSQSITNIRDWRGISPTTRLADHYADKLRDMSSTLPESWRVGLLKEHGYQLDSGVVMLLPGTSIDLVRLAFQMSGLTGRTAQPQ